VSASPAPEFIKLLAHDLRWSILKALSKSDLQVNELVDEVKEPMNLVSYHLKKMRDDALVTTRRSEADGRDVYYSLDLDHVKRLYDDAARALHPALSLSHQIPRLYPTHQVLFVCTHNSARSQMAAALMRHQSNDQFTVYSAGSHPTQVHPDAITTMAEFGIDIRDQQARNVREFKGQAFDYVITVCDKAREVCPTFSGKGIQLHWGFPDPVGITNTAERATRFLAIAKQLQVRTDYFLQSL
jgi:ArsR family transcriptional regulator, arsenate/arsenite/antimonite-responsive transcriptional repressor / arsenate reductase (thioredoxin)